MSSGNTHIKELAKYLLQCIFEVYGNRKDKFLKPKPVLSPQGELQRLVSAITEDLKDTRVVIPVTSSFILSVWPVQKTDGCWIMSVDNHKLNQVVNLISSSVPSIFSLLELVNTAPHIWYAAIDLENTSFLQTE